MTYSRKQRRKHDDDQIHSRPARINSNQLKMLAMQHHLGNQAVQRMLAQRQAPEQTAQKEDTKALVEAGKVKIERPEIKEYEVRGNNLFDITHQIKPPDKWYEYKYQYAPKVENGVVTQVDVTVAITIHLPRWMDGWQQAPDEDKMAWLQLLQLLTGNSDGYEKMAELPQPWLGLDWETVPSSLKGEWEKMLREYQTQENGPVDIARRRTIVLQQRMINHPEQKIKEVFDLFQKDVKIEETAYSEQTEFGKQKKIVLGNDALLL